VFVKRALVYSCSSVILRAVYFTEADGCAEHSVKFSITDISLSGLVIHFAGSFLQNIYDGSTNLQKISIGTILPVMNLLQAQLCTYNQETY
jgi:hypothetical protein